MKEKLKIKVAKWGTPKKYLKTTQIKAYSSNSFHQIGIPNLLRLCVIISDTDMLFLS
jgi:hypothetical protein